jgi:hypothetical protein
MYFQASCLPCAVSDPGGMPCSEFTRRARELDAAGTAGDHAHLVVQEAHFYLSAGLPAFARVTTTSRRVGVDAAKALRSAASTSAVRVTLEAGTP